MPVEIPGGRVHDDLMGPKERERAVIFRLVLHALKTLDIKQANEPLIFKKKHNDDLKQSYLKSKIPE